jgi:hypothetical protein
VHTVLDMAVGCVDVFRVVSSFQDSQGHLISEWEAVLGGPSLAHGPCLETTGRHRRTNSGPGRPLTLPSHGFKYMVPGAHEDGIGNP